VRTGPVSHVLELAIVLVLIALNGLFSLSELAIVSSRKVRLKTMVEARRRGASTALGLAESPGRFLSTVQIGITLVGILAGAFSGAALGDILTAILVGAGIEPWIADPAGFGIVIVLITYLSVVVGELVPKHLALKNPEAIACAVAPLMSLLSKVTAPIVWLLDCSTRVVFRLFGTSTESSNAVTDEEIRTIVAEAETAGVIETDERRMIAGVLRLGDRAVRSIMTPRTDVDWIDLRDGDEAIRRQLIAAHHTRIPVSNGDADDIVGVVESRDLLAALLSGEPLDIRGHIRQVPVIPDTVEALDVLDVLRNAEVPLALVHDEYGHFEGVVTPADILDAIAGAFRSDEADNDPDIVRRDDGSWLLSGSMPVDEMAEQTGFPLPANRDYETVAGLVLALLQRLPETGETATYQDWHLEVVDMDGRRIDKVIVTNTKPEYEG
jgi:putative hemolysin